MLAKAYTAQVIGLKPELVEVEVDIGRGLHSFTIVGLPDKAVEEARDRLSAAIKNSGFAAPQKSNKKVIVSLAPADVKKEGTSFDLAMALAYLAASQEIKFEPKGRLFLGELALNGELRPVKGVLMMTRMAKARGWQEIYVPTANAAEAALIHGLTIYPVRTLREVADHLSPPADEPSGEIKLELLVAAPPTELPALGELALAAVDLADVKGQATAKRGLEIAAAGGHNLALSGPPGTGKTMLARALIGLLPPLDFEEVLEVTGIHSAAGNLEGALVRQPPLRAPHHTASYVSLVGGGAWPRPGEITLAHRGILFLDEFPEFEHRVIEALRQPLEDRVITIARAKGSMSFPASFILVAAMNPCPCGKRGASRDQCICSPAALSRYDRKLSGPIVDRIDLWLEVPPVDHHKLGGDSNEESSTAVRERVREARERQRARFKAEGPNLNTNSEMGVKQLKKFAPLGASETKLLTESAKRLNLSARAYHRVIKLARTIADLAGAETIADSHLLEALQYRPKQNA